MSPSLRRSETTDELDTLTARSQDTLVRVLYLAYRVPYPPDKGERIRAFHQIRCLSSHAEISLICPTEEAPSAEALTALRQYCTTIVAVPDTRPAASWREGTQLLLGGPRSARTFVSRRLRAAVAHACSEQAVDRIFVSTLLVAEAARGLCGVPKIIDLVDIYSRLWLDWAERRSAPLGWLSRIEGRRLARYESELAAEFNAVVVSSHREAELFGARGGSARAAVVGNGVDLEYFRPAAPTTAPDTPQFVFTASMDYGPNEDAVRFFCDAILPRVRASHPCARFTIVGRKPTRAVRSLAHDAGVRVTGAVADVRPYLAAATAAVAPLRLGQGIQNKVLEAMAMGAPVVATSVALAGLDGSVDAAAIRADRPETFAAELTRLASDARWRAERAATARTYVERMHRWDDHCASLWRIIERASRD